MMTRHTNLSLPADIVIGKDILELVSSSMYVDPRTVFREYVQNAADSIDEAKAAGVLRKHEAGKVTISIDLEEETRSIKISDNGVGVPNGEFARRLMAVGGSRKRGTNARGFRGVGRLAGLGYCQELIFRSRSSGDEAVQELRWDCKLLKKLLSDHTYHGSLHELISRVASVTAINGSGWPKHFYEVELSKPSRIKNDLLLNRDAISSYLSQVGPVPFSPDFDFAPKIRSFLKEHLGPISEIDIFFDGDKTPLYRPYRNTFSYGECKNDSLTEPVFKVIEGVNGGVAAVVWLMHHGYHGAIPRSEGIAGLRARKGNIQVGDQKLFSSVFPEARFVSWTVGEVHVIDERIIPNGRRDDFEQGAHYNNLLTRLSEIGDHVARMCRSSSIIRNRIRVFDLGAERIEEHLSILKQGALKSRDSKNLIEKINSQFFEIKKVVTVASLPEIDRSELKARCDKLEKKITKAVKMNTVSDALRRINERERLVVQKMIALIYECSANQVATKSLVDRILAKLGTS